MTPAPHAPSPVADWLRTLPPLPEATAVVVPRTGAQETVLRMACALWALDLDASFKRVEAGVPWRPAERQAIQGPLLAWVRAAHPEIVAIVVRQFAPEESSV